MLRQQRFFMLLGERAAPEHEVVVRQRDRLGRRVDHTQQEPDVRPAAKGVEILPADRKENPSGVVRQTPRGVGGVRSVDPTVLRLPRPWRSIEPETGDPGDTAGCLRISGYLLGEGVGGIDKPVDGLIRKVSRKPVRAAEPADSGGARHRCRVKSSACKRRDRLEGGVVVQRPGQIYRLDRPTEDENAFSAQTRSRLRLS